MYFSFLPQIEFDGNQRTFSYVVACFSVSIGRITLKVEKVGILEEKISDAALFNIFM